MSFQWKDWLMGTKLTAKQKEPTVSILPTIDLTTISEEDVQSLSTLKSQIRNTPQSSDASSYSSANQYASSTRDDRTLLPSVFSGDFKTPSVSRSEPAHLNHIEEFVLESKLPIPETTPHEDSYKFDDVLLPPVQNQNESSYTSRHEGWESKKDFLLPYTINIQKQLLNLGTCIDNIRTPFPQHLHLQETHMIHSLSLLKEHVCSNAEIDSVTMNIINIIQEYANERQTLNTTLIPDIRMLLNDLEVRNQNMHSKILSLDNLIGKIA